LWLDALWQAGHAVHANCAEQCGQRARVWKVSKVPPHPSGAQTHCVPMYGDTPQAGQATSGRRSLDAIGKVQSLIPASR